MEKRRIYLKEWRDHRDLTQRQVVDRLAAFDDPKLPKTEASLSRYENGKQIYNERILNALAEIYEAEPHWLISRNPLKAGEVVHAEFSDLTEAQQESIRTMIASFRAG